MKKIFLIGAMLIASMTAMGDIIEVIGENGSSISSKTVYLPLTITGELVDIKDKVYLKIKPTSNIGPDGSSIMFDFGKLVKGDTSTLVGEFTAEVIKNTNGTTEKNVSIGTDTLWTSFDPGVGSGSGAIDTTNKNNKKTSITSEIKIAKDGTTAIAPTVGHIDYTLTGSFEATDKYIGNVQADIRVDGDGAKEADSVGAFIDKTQRVAVIVKSLEVEQ